MKDKFNWINILQLIALFILFNMVIGLFAGFLKILKKKPIHPIIGEIPDHERKIGFTVSEEEIEKKAKENVEKILKELPEEPFIEES